MTVDILNINISLLKTKKSISSFFSFLNKLISCKENIYYYYSVILIAVLEVYA